MLRSWSLVALAPLLVMQALAVRRKSLRLPEAAGPRSGTCGRGERLGLLVIGDSAAAGVGVATQDEALAGQLCAHFARRYRVDWRLLATTGHTAADALRALEQLDAFRVDVVVTSLGVNDVVARTPIRRFGRTMVELIERLRQRGAHGIVLSGIPPMGRFPLLPQPLRAVLGIRAAELDAVLAEVARDCGAVHLPLGFSAALGPEHLAADGFHPGPAIYRAWADAAHAALEGSPAMAAVADGSVG